MIKKTDDTVLVRLRKAKKEATEFKKRGFKKVGRYWVKHSEIKPMGEVRRSGIRLDFGEVSNKEFHEVFPKLPREFRKKKKKKGMSLREILTWPVNPELSEKENLEFIRMNLKTAMHRLEEANKLLAGAITMLEWEAPMGILAKCDKLLDGASIEIKRAGVGLK